MSNHQNASQPLTQNTSRQLPLADEYDDNDNSENNQEDYEQEIEVHENDLDHDEFQDDSTSPESYQRNLSSTDVQISNSGARQQFTQNHHRSTEVADPRSRPHHQAEPSSTAHGDMQIRPSRHRAASAISTDKTSGDTPTQRSRNDRTTIEVSDLQQYIASEQQVLVSLESTGKKVRQLLDLVTKNNCFDATDRARVNQKYQELLEQIQQQKTKVQDLQRKLTRAIQAVEILQQQLSSRQKAIEEFDQEYRFSDTCPDLLHYFAQRQAMLQHAYENGVSKIKKVAFEDLHTSNKNLANDPIE